MSARRTTTHPGFYRIQNGRPVWVPARKVESLVGILPIPLYGPLTEAQARWLAGAR